MGTAYAIFIFISIIFLVFLHNPTGEKRRYPLPSKIIEISNIIMFISAATDVLFINTGIKSIDISFGRMALAHLTTLDISLLFVILLAHFGERKLSYFDESLSSGKFQLVSYLLLQLIVIASSLPLVIIATILFYMSLNSKTISYKLGKNLTRIYTLISCYFIGYIFSQTNSELISTFGFFLIVLTSILAMGVKPWDKVLKSQHSTNNDLLELITPLAGAMVLISIETDYMGDNIRLGLSILFMLNGLLNGVASLTQYSIQRLTRSFLQIFISFGLVAYIWAYVDLALLLWVLGMAHCLLFRYFHSEFSRDGNSHSLEQIGFGITHSKTVTSIYLFLLLSFVALPLSPNLFVYYDLFLIFKEGFLDPTFFVSSIFIVFLFFISVYRVCWYILQNMKREEKQQSAFPGHKLLPSVVMTILFILLTLTVVPDLYADSWTFTIKSFWGFETITQNSYGNINFQSKNLIVLMIIGLSLLSAGLTYVIYSNGLNKKMDLIWRYRLRLIYQLTNGEFQGPLVERLVYSVFKTVKVTMGCIQEGFVFLFPQTISYAVDVARNWLFTYRPKGINSNLLYIQGTLVLIVIYCFWD